LDTSIEESVTEGVLGPLGCDLLILVATPTEEQQLKTVARELGLAFQPRNAGSLVGEYFSIGRVGDFVVNAVRSEMGPLSHGGSASRGILCQQATGATALVQLGMAFGVDRVHQTIGDVLVSTAVLPYDNRDVRTENDDYAFDYQRVNRHPAKASLVALFRDEDRRGKFEQQVHVGELLSGAARVFSRYYLAELIEKVPGVEDGIVGGEMEGVGLLSVSPRKEPLWIVIKGICDFADEQRDVEIKETRPLACRNSAMFVLRGLLNASGTRRT
jgi:nucleoside phosphorylase